MATDFEHELAMRLYYSYMCCIIYLPFFEVSKYKQVPDLV